jgi:putative ATPase
MNQYEEEHMNSNFTPLAERCRPRNLDEIIGQPHLTSKSSPFREMVESGKLHSFILWGPPGTGKTTLARVVAKKMQADFYEISAVNAGVKEIREILKKARDNQILFKKQTILFIDEIHRFSKNQQDSLLQSVEEGDIVLIGATTENPSFEVITPLLSRCEIYILHPLSEENIREILFRAIKTDSFLKNYSISIERDAVHMIYHASAGDARRALNILEFAVQSVKLKKNSDQIKIDKNDIKRIANSSYVPYDKSGDLHYDLISAFIKSVRGSDPDAALYWMARILNAGEKPEFIARRLIILASEDIGNAQPSALLIANAAFDAVHKIGMPEAGIILAQATTYLAASPKSNASYLAFMEAMKLAREHPALQVPLHLRNAPTNLMKKMKFGENYQYPHDFPEHFTDQDYLPDAINNVQFYNPTSLGIEAKLKEYLKKIWKDKKRYD